MKKTRKTVPTELELELLKVVWRLGKATVREVYKDMLERRDIAYTTVLTMMGVLEHKGHLKKKPGDRAYVYTAARPQEQVVQSMVSEFVNRVFDGAAKPLLMHLVEDQTRIQPEDLDEIERALRARKKKT
jgi:BlaI family penicillinase repressor